MKTIYLNCWQGNIFEKLSEFIKKHSLDTDIFCFQEVPPELFSRISNTLPDYYGQHEVGGMYYSHNVWYAHAIFVKKDITTSVSKKLPIFKDENGNIGFIQYLSFKKDGKKIYLGNLHGIPHPGNKLDTLSRINQSQKIIELFKKLEDFKIFGGDFNLMPDTKSIKLIKEAGFRNLIEEYNIKTTRNSLSWRVHSKEDKNFVKQYYADYLFISPEIKVKNFEVPDMEISDHLPMILDFEL